MIPPSPSGRLVRAIAGARVGAAIAVPVGALLTGTAGSELSSSERPRVLTAFLIGFGFVGVATVMLSPSGRTVLGGGLLGSIAGSLLGIAMTGALKGAILSILGAPIGFLLGCLKVAKTSPQEPPASRAV